MPDVCSVTLLAPNRPVVATVWPRSTLVVERHIHTNQQLIEGGDMDLINQPVSNLGDSEEQAKGGTGMLIELAQYKLSGDELARSLTKCRAWTTEYPLRGVPRTDA